MSQPPSPGVLSWPYDAPSPPGSGRPTGWVEPTRRTHVDGRFPYAGRYGAAVVAVVLGAYLIATDRAFPTLLQTIGYGVGAAPEQALYLAGEALAGPVVVLAGLSLMPTGPRRRLVALALVAASFVAGAAFAAARSTTVLTPEPWALVAANPVFVATFAALLGWLVIRARPVASYLVLAPTVAVGVVPMLVTTAIASTLGTMIALPIAAVTGIGGAWAARAVARTLRR